MENMKTSAATAAAEDAITATSGAGASANFTGGSLSSSKKATKKMTRKMKTAGASKSVSAGSSSSSKKATKKMTRKMKTAGASKSVSAGSSSSSKKAAKKMPRKMKTTRAEDGKKKDTRAASSMASLKTLMDSVSSFRSDEAGKKKEVTKAMGVNDFSEASVNILMSHYKVQDQDILRNTALAMFPLDSKKGSFTRKFGSSSSSSLESLERYQQLFMEQKLTAKETARLVGHADDLDMAANAALQAMLLVSAMLLTGKRPAGLTMKVPRKSSGLAKPDIKKRLSLIVTISEILFQKSKTSDTKEIARLAKIHKDLLKIVGDF